MLLLSEQQTVNMSHVDVKNLKPSSFEEEYYDQYDYYNLTDKYAGEQSVLQVSPGDPGCCFTCVSSTEASARKGRTKKEASENTNRPSPSGHERKLVEKLQNSEKKSKE